MIRRIGRKSSAATGAFSLVEVVLAMGIVSFGLIVLLGLLPAGFKSNRDSTEESQAINLLYALITDRQSSVYSITSSMYSLPAISSVTAQTTGSLYTTDEGTLTTAPDKARYLIKYTIYPPADPKKPVAMALRISWPAMQTNQSAAVETLATFMPQ